MSFSKMATKHPGGWNYWQTRATGETHRRAQRIAKRTGIPYFDALKASRWHEAGTLKANAHRVGLSARTYPGKLPIYVGPEGSWPL